MEKEFEEKVKLLIHEVYESVKNDVEELDQSLSEYQLRGITCTIVESMLNEADPENDYKLNAVYDSMADYFKSLTDQVKR